MALHLFPVLCNHHLCPRPQVCHLPKWRLCPYSTTLPTTPPCVLGTSILISASRNWPIPGTSSKWNHTCPFASYFTYIFRVYPCYSIKVFKSIFLPLIPLSVFKFCYSKNNITIGLVFFLIRLYSGTDTYLGLRGNQVIYQTLYIRYIV